MWKGADHGGTTKGCNDVGGGISLCGRSGHVVRVETSYEIKNAGVTRLPALITHYAAELIKDNHGAEIILTPDGMIVAPAKWAGNPQ